MRIETILRICQALHITPDKILTEDNPSSKANQAELFAKLDTCTPDQRETALKLLAVYLDSL